MELRRVTRSMTKAMELGQVMRATTKKDTVPGAVGKVKRAVSRRKGKGKEGQDVELRRVTRSMTKKGAGVGGMRRRG
jgi:ribosomal protein S6